VVSKQHIEDFHRIFAIYRHKKVP